MNLWVSDITILTKFYFFRMLDDMSTELENAGSKLDSNLKKIAKVLHMNNGMFYLLIFISIISVNKLYIAI